MFSSSNDLSQSYFLLYFHFMRYPSCSPLKVTENLFMKSRHRHWPYHHD